MLRYLPQKGVHSHLFLPPESEIPEGESRVIGFNFPGLGPLATANDQEPVQRDFVWYAITATVKAAAGYVPAFSIMFYHGHGKAQRQLWHQAMQANLVGTAADPYYLPSPYLLGRGDVVSCEVANAIQAGGRYVPADIYISLWGVECRG